MARSEAGGAAQHDAGGHAFAAVEREELFGEERQVRYAAANIVVSVTLGLATAAVGVWLGARL